jgi:hypothetical protein
LEVIRAMRIRSDRANCESALHWARRYATCTSEEELLATLSIAIACSADDLASTLRPRWQRSWTWGIVARLAPGECRRQRRRQANLLAESVAFVARKWKLFLSQRELVDAGRVCGEAAMGAGLVLSERLSLCGEDQAAFLEEVAHVLLKHLHFPPEDDDSAMVRLVAARGQKLRVAQAVRFLSQLVGADPVTGAAPMAFVDRWQSLTEGSWADAASA